MVQFSYYIMITNEISKMVKRVYKLALVKTVFVISHFQGLTFHAYIVSVKR